MKRDFLDIILVGLFGAYILYFLFTLVKLGGFTGLIWGFSIVAASYAVGMIRTRQKFEEILKGSEKE